MTDGSLPLTIDQIKSSFSVPVVGPMQSLLEHLQFNMDVDLSFEIVSHGGFNCRIQLLAGLDINLVSLPLADIFAQLLIVTRKNEFHEFAITERSSIVKIVEAHHQLTILQTKLIPIILPHKIVKVDGVELLIAVGVKSTEGCIRFEVIQLCELLSFLFHVKFKISQVPEK